MFISLLLSNTLLNLGQQMSNALLSLYAKSMDVPADRIGTLMSMFAVTALIFRFIAGPAINAYQRKGIVVGSLCQFAAAYFGFGAAASISAISGVDIVVILQFFRLVQGIGNAFANACCMAIAAELIPRDKFTAGISIYACGQVVAQAIGPTVGVLLRNLLSYPAVYMLFGCLMLLDILPFVLLVKLPPHNPKPFRLEWKNMFATEAAIPTVITFLVAMGYTAINSFLLVYAEERGIDNGSFFFAVYAFVMLVTRPLIGKLTDRYGFVRVGIPAILFNAVSLILIAFSNGLAMLLIAAFVNAFGYGAVQPALQSLCMKSVPAARRGSASATSYIGQDAATIIGPILCGHTAAITGYTPAMWLIMTVPILAGMVLTFLCRVNIYRIEDKFRGEQM